MNEPEIDKNKYEIHPAAQLFPKLNEQEHEELKADITANGQSAPIVKKGNVILDGRNRFRACNELGIEPRFIEYEGNDEVAFIVSMNLLRRHLTDDQRVAILAKLHALRLSEEADRRKREGVGAKSSQGRVREQIAIEAQVGDHKARSALAALKHAPEKLDDVIAGKAKLRETRKAVDMKSRRRPAIEKPLRERVEKAYLALMLKFSPIEYRAVREIVRKILDQAGKQDGVITKNKSTP